MSLIKYRLPTGRLVPFIMRQTIRSSFGRNTVRQLLSLKESVSSLDLTQFFNDPDGDPLQFTPTPAIPSLSRR